MVDQVTGADGCKVTAGQWVIAKVNGKRAAIAHVSQIKSADEVEVGIHFNMNGTMHAKARMYRTVAPDQIRELKNPPRAVQDRMILAEQPKPQRRKRNGR